MSRLSGEGHRIIMLEPPLFPFKNGFGLAQREIAAKYGAALAPKRVMVAALRSGTVDGLHLSQAGHAALAESIAEILEPDSRGDIETARAERAATICVGCGEFAATHSTHYSRPRPI
jgi:hypothetical protein